MYARSRPRRAANFVVPAASSQSVELEQVVAYCLSNHSASIPEEILGFGRQLPTESEEGEEPYTGGKGFGPRTRPIAPAVEQHRPEVAAG